MSDYLDNTDVGSNLEIIVGSYNYTKLNINSLEPYLCGSNEIVYLF